jgi:signal peptidase I
MREAHSVELARAQSPRAGWSNAGLRLCLAALWFAVIPALWSALALRYLVPVSLSATGLEGELASLGRSHTLLVVLSLFLIFTALIRYWRLFLPGGRYLSSLPSDLVERVPRRRVAVCEEASALLRWLESAAGGRWLAGSPAELQQEVARAQTELSADLSRGKWSRVGVAYDNLKELTRRSEGAGVVKNLSFVALLGCAALTALALRATFFQSYEVLGTSMLPSLSGGDLLAGRMLTSAQSARELKRGDVVVLRVMVDGREQEIIKRVIGLPGDRITMQGVHPVINGWPVPVCAAGAYYSPDDETAMQRGDPGGVVALEFLDGASYLTFQAAPGAPFPEYVVKPGEVFVLGDNRNNSRDSRVFDQGAPRGFPLTDVKAKVQRVVLSRTRRGDIDPASVWRPLGPTLHLDALDTSEEQAGIRRCLAARPAQTNPPSPSASAALASDAP